MKSNEIQDKYWEMVLTKKEPFASVYDFCQQAGVEEATFYESYASLDVIEADYWTSTVEMTLKTLKEDEGFADYNLEQKLLSFYYTYISGIQPYRSRLIAGFPSSGGTVKLKHMKARFIEFTEKWVNEAVESGDIADRKKLTTYYGAGLFEQFKVILEFYKRDQSSGFQDTDAFIEKSVRFGIETAKTGVLEAGLDFARFMIGRLPKVR